LKKLDIAVCQDLNNRRQRGKAKPNIVADIFEDAPLFTHLVLCGSPAQRLKFNWSSLTILQIKAITHCKDALSVLRETINSVDLELSRPDDMPEGGESIKLPRLDA
jgi:hypothetical protein